MCGIECFMLLAYASIDVCCYFLLYLNYVEIKSLKIKSLSPDFPPPIARART